MMGFIFLEEPLRSYSILPLQGKSNNSNHTSVYKYIIAEKIDLALKISRR